MVRWVSFPKHIFKEPESMKIITLETNTHVYIEILIPSI